MLKRGILIGISASATAGKDTFANILTEIVQKEGYKVSKFAFANALKQELDPLFKHFGGTAFETDPKKKTKIRPILVSHGCTMREITKGRYWIEKIDPEVRAALDKGNVVVVTDVRFAEYENDEVYWIHSLGGKIVYIERYKEDGSIVPPANQEEERNDPKLRKIADYIVSWRTEKNLDKLLPFVYDVWRKAKVELDTTKQKK